MATRGGEGGRELYPALEPYDTGRLRVGGPHELYYEQSGNPQGNPVIFLHGGPGFRCSPTDRRYFDPAAYRIILLDQRGAGRSTPAACIEDNTTWELVGDLERVRVHLGVERWVVFGGSWGSTLGLVYAIKHPGRVKALILRGIFTIRRKELDWFYQDGANQIFPEFHEQFVAPIPEVERHDLLGAYYRRFTGGDHEEMMRCAHAWSRWEMQTARLLPDPDLINMTQDDTFALQYSKVICHFYVKGAFFDSDTWVLDNVASIRHIPCTLVQGRYDMACPPTTAWQLHKRWPESELHIVPDAGHNPREPGLLTQLLNATDKYKTLP